MSPRKKEIEGSEEKKRKRSEEREKEERKSLIDATI
jgi:hypothetical protein